MSDAEWLSSAEVMERHGMGRSCACNLMAGLDSRREYRQGPRRRSRVRVVRAADVAEALAKRTEREGAWRLRRARIRLRWDEGSAVPDIAEAFGMRAGTVTKILYASGIQSVARERKEPRKADARPRCGRCRIILAEAEQMIPGGDDQHCAACLYRIQTGQRWTYAALREAA